MITTTTAFLLLLLTLPVVLLLYVTESRQHRCQRMRRNGWTLARIAKANGISERTVRRDLALAVA